MASSIDRHGSRAALIGLVVVLGPALTRIPLDLVQVVVCTLLLLFGLGWLRKAILRAAGVIALHDEEAAYADETASLPNGEVLTVTATDPKEVQHIRGLGFIGLIVSGSHHQPQAKGEFAHMH